MRQIVENVFGRLKAKFEFIRGNKMKNLHKMKRIIHALCIVYNMQMAHKDPNLPTEEEAMMEMSDSDDGGLADGETSGEESNDDNVYTQSNHVTGDTEDNLNEFQLDERHGAVERMTEEENIPSVITRLLLERLYT